MANISTVIPRLWYQRYRQFIILKPTHIHLLHLHYQTTLSLRLCCSSFLRIACLIEYLIGMVPEAGKQYKYDESADVCGYIISPSSVQLSLLSGVFSLKRLLPSRRCANAVLAMTLCPSVCLSVRLSHADIVSKRLNRSSSFLAQRLPSASSALCWKGLRVSAKIRLVPSRIFPQTLDLQKN